MDDVSVLAEDYPTWSTRFSAFAETKGLIATTTDTVELPDRPVPLRKDANDEQTQEHEVENQARATAVQEDESRKHQISCYLAMTQDTSSLTLIRHDCVNSKGLGDVQKSWRFLQQRFRSDENNSQKSDETVGQTTTARGRSHPPELHHSARTDQTLESFW